MNDNSIYLFFANVRKKQEMPILRCVTFRESGFASDFRTHQQSTYRVNKWYFILFTYITTGNSWVLMFFFYLKESLYSSFYFIYVLFLLVLVFFVFCFLNFTFCILRLFSKNGKILMRVRNELRSRKARKEGKKKTFYKN